MTSKLERWKKLSTSTKESRENPNKAKIVEDLAKIPNVYLNESEQKEKQKNNENMEIIISNKDNDEVGVINRSIDDTLKDVVNEFIKEPENVENFAIKVNSAVRQYIENKQTKEDTHKKTSFLIRLDLLAKLENFNNAHGGRVKGEFINHLLEEAFAELEQDPQWNKILNKDIEKMVNKMKKRR